MDRKRYSKARENALWRVVDDAFYEFRIKVLKGCLEGLTPSGREDIVYQHLHGLADKVASVYRERIEGGSAGSNFGLRNPSGSPLRRSRNGERAGASKSRH